MRRAFVTQASTCCWLFAATLACSRTPLEALEIPPSGKPGGSEPVPVPAADAAPAAGPDAAASGPAGEMTLLAEGQLNPAGIAVDQRSVHWLNLGASQRITGTNDSTPYMGGQIVTCAKDGCGQSPTLLASGRWQSIATHIPVGFATDGEAVYWSDTTPLTDGGGAEAPAYLYRCSVAGCGRSPEIVGEESNERLAVYGGYLVWTRFEAVVNFCPTTGCGPSPRSLWSAGDWPCATGIAVDGSGVYWTTTNADIFKCPLVGCDNAPAILMTAGAKEAVATFDLAIDADHVYLADRNASGFGMILKCAKTGCGDQPIVLASGLDAPMAVATDGLRVYWLEGNRVRRCATSGCGNAPATLATGVGNLAALALDGSHAYVADTGSSWSDGRIWKVHK
jgi:hypothetical protein